MSKQLTTRSDYVITTLSAGEGESSGAPWGIIFIITAVILALIPVAAEYLTAIINLVKEKPLGFSTVVLLIAAAIYTVVGRR